jgi:hypothetical protein
MHTNVFMKHTFTIILFICSVCAAPLFAQNNAKNPDKDSTIIFGELGKPVLDQTSSNKLTSSWGVDLLISTNGFGVGTFYRHEYSDDFSGYIDFSISESKDDNEIEYIDYYGNTFTPGKLNRFLVLPLFLGVEKRMFKDDITDNFRPFIDGAIGPSMIYIFPYNEEYFTALGKGHPTYTFGGFVGIGAYFGSERSNILGMNIRYYFVPYPGGLESMEQGSTVLTKNQFGGLVISLSFGTSW